MSVPMANGRSKTKTSKNANIFVNINFIIVKRNPQRRPIFSTERKYNDHYLVRITLAE